MSLPVLFVHASAFRTGPRGVARVDDMQINAVHQGLVGHKGPELSEGPVVQPVSLGFSGRNLVPDAGKIFDGDPGASAFGLGNKVLGDVVVDPRLKTVLPVGQFFQSSFAGLRSLLLKRSSSFLIPETLVLDGSS